MTKISPYARQIIIRELIDTASRTQLRFANADPLTANPEQTQAAHQYIEICATLTELRCPIPAAPKVLQRACDIMDEHNYENRI